MDGCYCRLTFLCCCFCCFSFLCCANSFDSIRYRRTTTAAAVACKGCFFFFRLRWNFQFFFDFSICFWWIEVLNAVKLFNFSGKSVRKISKCHVIAYNCRKTLFKLIAKRHGLTTIEKKKKQNRMTRLCTCTYYEINF